MNHSLARFLSVILHPVLMPTYALLFIFNRNTFFAYTTPFDEKIRLFTIILVNTLILPVAISYFLVVRGWIKSLEMEKREERIIPYLSNILLMMLAYYMMRRLGLPLIFQLLILGAAASVMVAVMINIKWKISIHMIGMGAMIGTFFGMSNFMVVDLRIPILICLVIGGLLGTARLSLGAHQPFHIYAGFFVGFFCEYLVLSMR